MFFFPATSVSNVFTVFQFIENGNVLIVNSSFEIFDFKAVSNSAFEAKVEAVQPFAALFSIREEKSVLKYVMDLESLRHCWAVCVVGAYFLGPKTVSSMVKFCATAKLPTNRKLKIYFFITGKLIVY